MSNSPQSSTFRSFQGFSFCAVLKRGPWIATHLDPSSHIISHAFCLCSCAAHACWDNKLGASLRSWKRYFTTKSGGMPSFLPVLPAPVLITCKPTVWSSCWLIKSIYLFLLSWYSSWTSGLQNKKNLCAKCCSLDTPFANSYAIRFHQVMAPR